MARPTIALNLAYWQPARLGGTETYARELLRQFERADPGLDFLLLLNPESFPTVECSVPWVRKLPVPISAAGAARRHLREQALLPGIVRRERIALLHSPGYVLPLAVRVPQVLTVHDMLYKRHPQYLPFAKRWFWRALIPLSVRRAARVVAVSESTRRDLMDLLGVPAPKLRTIPHGVTPFPPATPEQVREVAACYGIAGPYVLTVGCGAHKRVDLLIRACSQLRQNGLRDLTLVILGVPEDASARLSGEGVLHPGFVPREHLAPLYAGARLYATASSFEGFGLPLLEAMAAGTPVVSSDCGSLAEVGGDAVLLVRRHQAEDYAHAIARLWQEEDLRARLIAAGRRRLQVYSWEHAARQHLEVYREALAGGGG